MEVPSKELLIEILKDETIASINEGIPSDVKNDNEVQYYKDGLYGVVFGINIYELMHMMKEWAWGEGYAIGVDMLGLKSFNVNIHSLDTEHKVYNKDEYQVEDFEAVTKACEWMLNQKENNEQA